MNPLWIFLDFDGVIMDSMALKLDSYCHAFEEFGFAREDVQREQLRTAGLSRYRIIPAIYEALSATSMPKDAYERALTRFEVHDDASRSQMVLKQGALEFLVAAKNRIPLVVVTGTPQAVIDKTIGAFDLSGFFREVCGSPQTKTEHLRQQMLVRNLEPQQALYVGDAVHDWESALECGMPFVGIDNGDHPFVEKSVQAVVSNLGELIPLLKVDALG